jgi:hypothetical protein
MPSLFAAREPPVWLASCIIQHGLGVFHSTCNHTPRTRHAQQAPFVSLHICPSINKTLPLCKWKQYIQQEMDSYLYCRPDVSAKEVDAQGRPTLGRSWTISIRLLNGQDLPGSGSRHQNLDGGDADLLYLHKCIPGE